MQHFILYLQLIQVNRNMIYMKLKDYGKETLFDSFKKWEKYFQSLKKLVKYSNVLNKIKIFKNNIK